MPLDDVPLELVVPLEVRFGDLDAFGHVNNAMFLTYLENARVAHYRQFIGVARPEDFKAVVARVEIDYKAPIWLNSPVVCHVGITELGRSSLVYEYRLCSPDGRTEYARARSVHVLFDRATQRTMPLDETFRASMIQVRTARGLPPPLDRRSA